MKQVKKTGLLLVAAACALGMTACPESGAEQKVSIAPASPSLLPDEPYFPNNPELSGSPVYFVHYKNNELKVSLRDGSLVTNKKVLEEAKLVNEKLNPEKKDFETYFFLGYEVSQWD